MQDAVFLFPGQGSQYTGMGKEFYDNFSIVRDLFVEGSEATGMDLKHLCFEGPDEILMQTENVQPAITLINVATFHVLKENGIIPAATAGHSLGEYTSLYAAGVIKFPDLMKLVQARGLFMKEAAAENTGGMVMPLGMSVEAIEKICMDLPEGYHLEIANINSPKQVIVSGTKEALEKFSALAKKAGTKLIVPLKVSGPWHSRLMTSAKEKLETKIAETTFTTPKIPFIANATGDYVSDEEQIKKNLIVQLSNTVQWNQSMGKFIQGGYSLFIEAGPKMVLKALMREINKDVAVYNVDNMKTLTILPSSEESTS